MQIFSPDGKYGYVCSSFNPEIDVVTVADHRIVGRVRQASPFCPNIAATPDGRQVWFTLKDTGKTQVFEARPPFALLKTLDTGPITNHVNIVRNANGMFAYVTVGGLNQLKVFRTDDFSQVATISLGSLPHGIWPSGDGTRVYVGLENADALAAIDTLTNRVIATVPIGQAPQAVTYVPDAVPEGDGTQNLQPLGIAGQTAHLAMVSTASAAAGPAGAAGAGGSGNPPTTVALFDQGLLQVLQASATALRARPRRQPGRQRQHRVTRDVHDEPGRLGHRQRDRPDPPDRRARRSEPERPAPLPHHRAARRRQAGRAGAGSGAVARRGGRRGRPRAYRTKVPSRSWS
jgi:YVTN family beta-propeller protein